MPGAWPRPWARRRCNCWRRRPATACWAWPACARRCSASSSRTTTRPPFPALAMTPTAPPSCRARCPSNPWRRAPDDRGGTTPLPLPQRLGPQGHRGAGGAGRQLARRRRPHHRPAGPQRRRQDHHAAGGGRPGRGRRGPGDGGRAGRGPRAAPDPGPAGRAVRRPRPVPAPDRAREHRLLRPPAGPGRRRRPGPRRGTGRAAGPASAAGPPHRGLQPGRAHEDRAGPRPGARPGQHRAGRAHQRPGRAGHARAARIAAPAARRAGQVHRLLHPHHAGGRAPVRRGGGHGPWPHRGPWQRARAAGAHRPRRLRTGLHRPGLHPRRRTRSGPMRHAWWVFLKELRDALRDRRTLRAVLLSAVLPGPLMLGLISMQVDDMERHVETRELVVQGIDHAPSLRNFAERQGWTLRDAPADFQAALRANRQGEPVLQVPEGFEAAMARGEMPRLTLVGDSANSRASQSQRRVQDLVQGWLRERATLELVLRGVSPAVLQPATLDTQDLADPAARGATPMSMLPFMVLMAVVSGALGAALDSTAGERERGSLEPLLMNPASRGAPVAGKWAAAMMAIAIRCRSVKEAQASATFLVLAVSLLPVVSTLNQTGEKPWQLWLPVVAQSTLMTRVLKAEAITAWDIALPALVCAGLTAAVLTWVARQLGRVVAR